MHRVHQRTSYQQRITEFLVRAVVESRFRRVQEAAICPLMTVRVVLRDQSVLRPPAFIDRSGRRDQTPRTGRARLA
jgi:hypothetical protein